MENQLQKGHNFVRLLIVVDDHDARYIYRQSYDIQQHILEHVYANGGKEPCPQFCGECEESDEGAIIINPHVDTVGWLEDVIGSYDKSPLRIQDITDRPEYTDKVEGWVPEVRLTVPVAKLLQLLQAQNAGLRTENWRLVKSEYSIRNRHSGKLMTFLIDAPSKEVLEKNGYKLFLGFTIVMFYLIEKVKRCEITGKIIRDDEIKSLRL